MESTIDAISGDDHQRSKMVLLPPANPLINRSFSQIKSINTIFSNPFQLLPLEMQLKPLLPSQSQLQSSKESGTMTIGQQLPIQNTATTITKATTTTTGGEANQIGNKIGVECKAMNLFEYHEQNKHNMIYSRFKEEKKTQTAATTTTITDNSNGFRNPVTSTVSSRYFASLIMNLESMEPTSHSIQAVASDTASTEMSERSTAIKQDETNELKESNRQQTKNDKTEQSNNDLEELLRRQEQLFLKSQMFQLPVMEQQKAQSTTLYQNNSSGQSKLQFSSEFESGNLFAAYQTDINRYDLILQNDINTKGNTQWFFFSVRNPFKSQKVTFTIINLVKDKSLFGKGLQPVRFSEKAKSTKNQDWVRDGFDVSYVRNNIVREVQLKGHPKKSYYSIQFSYVFEYDDDVVYFAHSYPYLYSDFKAQLQAILACPIASQYTSHRILCKTLAGNTCDQLTITNPDGTSAERAERKGIVFLARQHPGETNSSFVMKGILEFLLSQDPRAVFLRNKCVIKLIPMMNPDGVIHGNYRCNLAGVDLNRRWHKPRKKIEPCVFAVKNAIQRMHEEREIQLVLDLHGHSQKMGSFFYGCSHKESAMSSRVFPYLLSEINERVYFHESRFTFKPFQSSTARVALWKHLETPNVFTFETSFYGYALQQRQSAPIHFTREDYAALGRDICVNLYNILKDEQEDQDFRKTHDNLEIAQSSKLMDAALQKMAENPDLIEVGNLSDHGSDSNPSDDELSAEEMTLIYSTKKVKKKKEKWTRRNLLYPLSSSSATSFNPPIQVEQLPPKKLQSIKSSSVHLNTQFLEPVYESPPKTPKFLDQGSESTTENTLVSGSLRFQVQAARQGNKRSAAIKRFNMSQLDLKVLNEGTLDESIAVFKAKAEPLFNLRTGISETNFDFDLPEPEDSFHSRISVHNRMLRRTNQRARSSKRMMGELEEFNTSESQLSKQPSNNLICPKSTTHSESISQNKMGQLLLGRHEMTTFHSDIARMNNATREFSKRKFNNNNNNNNNNQSTDSSNVFGGEGSEKYLLGVISSKSNNILVSDRNQQHLSLASGNIVGNHPSSSNFNVESLQSRMRSTHRQSSLKQQQQNQSQSPKASPFKLLNASCVLPQDHQQSGKVIPGAPQNRNRQAPSMNPKVLFFCDSELNPPPVTSFKDMPKQNSYRTASQMNLQKGNSKILPIIPNAAVTMVGTTQGLVTIPTPKAIATTTTAAVPSTVSASASSYISSLLAPRTTTVGSRTLRNRSTAKESSQFSVHVQSSSAASPPPPQSTSNFALTLQTLQAKQTLTTQPRNTSSKLIKTDKMTLSQMICPSKL